MEELKMYFVCDFGGSGNWTCYGVLSNGFCFGTHLCSDPVFAPGDLYEGRPERIAALRELFGIDPETIKKETIKVFEEKDIPEWWASHADLQDGLKDKMDRYIELTLPKEMVSSDEN